MIEPENEELTLYDALKPRDPVSMIQAAVQRVREDIAEITRLHGQSDRRILIRMLRKQLTYENSQ